MRVVEYKIIEHNQRGGGRQRDRFNVQDEVARAHALSDTHTYTRIHTDTHTHTYSLTHSHRSPSFISAAFFLGCEYTYCSCAKHTEQYVRSRYPLLTSFNTENAASTAPERDPRARHRRVITRQSELPTLRINKNDTCASRRFCIYLDTFSLKQCVYLQYAESSRGH